MIEDGVTSIGDEAFMYFNISEIVIPESVTSIGDKAFYGCSMPRSIKISDNVSKIGTKSFSLCNGLEKILVSSNNPSYCSDAYGALYSKDMTELIQLPSKFMGDYELDESIDSIEEVKTIEDNYIIPQTVRIIHPLVLEYK